MRIYAHLQTVLTARDTALDLVMDAMNVTAIQNMVRTCSYKKETPKLQELLQTCFVLNDTQ